MAFIPAAHKTYAAQSEYRKRMDKAIVKAIYGPTPDGTTTTSAMKATRKGLDTAREVEQVEAVYATAAGTPMTASAMSATRKGLTAREGEVGQSEGEHAEGAEPPVAAAFEPEPGAAMTVDSAMEETREWLTSNLLTAAIPLFEERQVHLDSIAELSEEESRTWVSELPLDTLQKKRLLEAIAELRAIQTDEAKPEPSTEDVVVDFKEETTVEVFGEAEVAVASSKMSALDDSLQFFFDPSIQIGRADPSLYEVSGDQKTATGGRGRHILLKPYLSDGINVVKFKVEQRKAVIDLAVVDQCGKPLGDGCRFDGNGTVYKNGRVVAMSRPFGRSLGWKKGDVLILTMNMDSGKVGIKTNYGAYVVDWQPQSTPVWFAVSLKGTSAGQSTLSIM